MGELGCPHPSMKGGASMGPVTDDVAGDGRHGL